MTLKERAEKAVEEIFYNDTKLYNDPVQEEIVNILIQFHKKESQELVDALLGASNLMPANWISHTFPCKNPPICEIHNSVYVCKMAQALANHYDKIHGIKHNNKRREGKNE